MEWWQILLLIIGLIYNTKFFQWARLKNWGFRAETPLFFLKHPNAYTIIDFILFVIVLIFVEIAWYIIVVLYFVSFIIGGIMATNTVKSSGKELGRGERETDELIKSLTKRK